MKMNVTDTVKQACGHWPRILPALGMKVIKNRHQACPVCGGADRFRFDDKEGRGTWFCNQCGAGDGLKLVEKVFGVSPSDAAAKVAAVTGSLPPADPAVTAAAVGIHVRFVLHGVEPGRAQRTPLSPGVLRVVYRLEVLGVDAGPVPTHVVEFEPVRDLADQQRVD